VQEREAMDEHMMVPFFHKAKVRIYSVRRKKISVQPDLARAYIKGLRGLFTFASAK
jgi:hypothetical protein